MKFDYKLTEEDLTDYYKSLLRGEPNVKKILWTLRLIGAVPLVLAIVYAFSNRNWAILFAGVAVLWFLDVEYLFYPIYAKKVVKKMITPMLKELKPISLEISEERIKMNKQLQDVAGFQVLPQVFVIVNKNDSNIIIPNRVLDNDVNKLNELVSVMKTYCDRKREK